MQRRIRARRRPHRVTWAPLPASPLRDLHVNPIRILDVQTRVVALQRSRSTLCQIARGRFPAETGYPDREVVNNSGWASMVEGDQHLGIAEANNSARSVFADHSEAEHFLIELDGTLRVRDVNADVVDIRVLEVDAFLGDGAPTRSQHRETLYQLATTE